MATTSNLGSTVSALRASIIDLGSHIRGLDRKSFALLATGTLAFALLFWLPTFTLVRDWWVVPDAGHGLLLGPIAAFLAWRSGIWKGAQSRPYWGVALLLGAVLLRYVSGLAAEPFTMRVSLLGALGALTVYRWGFRQILHWWLPVTLLILSVPLPAVLLNSIAFPLQFMASSMGADLLAWRSVPVVLTGNVIQLPGYALFVTEACSGLRSLTALISLGVLMGGLWLSSPVSRVALIVLTLPVAIVVNSIRVFLTGFLVYFVDPALGEGFMHYSEGWVLFLGAFTFVSLFAFGLERLEKLLGRRGLAAQPAYGT